MKRIFFLMLIAVLLTMCSYAQKIIGIGGELSVLSFKPNVRMWFSKTTGAELFGGIASELEDIQPNDYEAGFKLLHAIQYSRIDRTYIGLLGKWKWVDVYKSYQTTSLPIPGVFIGKEWYNKRISRNGYAVELGYQFGSKKYDVTNHALVVHQRFEEFPLIFNLRYSFYWKK